MGLSRLSQVWLHWSLQVRLQLAVLGLLGLVWVGTGVLTWQRTEHELNELLDAHLSQGAALLATRPLDDLSREFEADLPALHKYQAQVVVQVWHAGELVVRSSNAPIWPLADLKAHGLSDRVIGAESWRVYTTGGYDYDVVIHVGELHSARRHILLNSLGAATLPMLLALPLLMLGVWLVVRGALRPLRALGLAVASRRPQSLAPLPTAVAPPEVLPLVLALNDLFERIAALLESERRFTADAAHELRTPIAAIRMQAQVAQGARSDEERHLALDATLQGCDRATRLVEQLLQLARLEAQADVQSGSDGIQRTDLAANARLVMADLAERARARQQVLELEAPSPVDVGMPAPLVQVLVRNLVDNALRYSPPGSLVRVTVGREPTSLSVEDSGSGLPSDALARLGERFYRVLGSGQSGSGLGWSIVRRLARLYRIDIELVSGQDLGGLRVKLRWLEQSRGD